jgi:hypothetical protein
MNDMVVPDASIDDSSYAVVSNGCDTDRSNLLDRCVDLDDQSIHDKDVQYSKFYDEGPIILNNRILDYWHQYTDLTYRMYPSPVNVEDFVDINADDPIVQTNESQDVDVGYHFEDDPVVYSDSRSDDPNIYSAEEEEDEEIINIFHHLNSADD